MRAKKKPLPDGPRTITIYGASDDLVYAEGEVPGCNEFGSFSDDPGFIEISTGDVFSIVYGKDGRWKVEHHVEKDAALQVTIQRAPEENEKDYTDRAVVTGSIDWVRFWPNWPPKFDDVQEAARDLADQLFERPESKAGKKAWDEVFEVLWRHRMAGSF